jgi:hypothetical protein
MESSAAEDSINTSDLISEELALKAVGVSGNTLNRFCEVGYLKTEVSNGVKSYFKSELCKVFNIKEIKLYNFPNAAENSQSLDLEDSSDSKQNEAQASPAYSEIATEENLSDTQNSEANESSDIISNEHKDSAIFHSEPAEPTNQKLEEDSQDNNSRKSWEMSLKLESLKDEVNKLKTIVQLQEKVLEIRESELADLKQQREWLQARVEKMEEQASRNQLLLISETQMLTKMIMLNKKPSPVKAALEWLGFPQSKEEQTNSTTVEMNKSK